MRTPSRLSALFLGLSLVGGLALAQETRASLSGTVTDSSGSIIPNTNLQLTNTGTGVVLSATSNEAGLYRFLFLVPGMYRLTAGIAGFKTFERGNIELNVNESATLPVVLEVGSLGRAPGPI